MNSSAASPVPVPLERPTVAYQGEPGAFSEEAVQAWFGDDVCALPRRTFGDVTAAVVRGESRYGLLPVENTLAGSVSAAMDAMLGAELQVIAEVIRPIRHCLLACEGASLEGLSRVLSHPVALAQCGRFFAAHPGLDAVAVHDTAGAARLVAEADQRADAAIASEAAARHWGLQVLARGLQDRPDNQTRFLVVARAGDGVQSKGTGTCKSLLVFETEDRPGALVSALEPFARRAINLTRLESRPGAEPWTYRFLAEAMGDLRSGEARAAVRDARRHTRGLRILGPFATRPTPQTNPGGREAPAGAEALDLARAAIDRLDDRLIELLTERLRLARQAQASRDATGRGGVDPAREAEVVRRGAAAARASGLPPEGVRRVLWTILGLCTPRRCA